MRGGLEKIIRAKYRKGIIEPLEKLEMEEEEEVQISAPSLPTNERSRNTIKAPAGALRKTVDCDELIKEIYKTPRLSAARPGVKL